MNSAGKEYGGDSKKESESMETIDSHLAYLKLINVPSMFDIGGVKADPTSDSLSLTLMDSITFKLVKKEILSRSVGRKVEEIEMLRQQLKAVHTSMNVSETTITFDKDDPLVLGGPNGKNGEYYLTIDGESFHTNPQELSIKKI